jgi:DNA-binding CsgD family transcriptional regulator
LEILGLIMAGHSNQEIADTLFLALSTVKWYINVIYGKLQVKTRSQAIAKAHDLGLTPTHEPHSPLPTTHPSHPPFPPLGGFNLPLHIVCFNQLRFAQDFKKPGFHFSKSVDLAHQLSTLSLPTF